MESMTPDQKNRVLEWVSVKARLIACTLCRSENLTVGDLYSPAVLMTQHGELTQDPEKSSMPLVPILCSACGHVVFFSAVTIGGIVSPPSREGVTYDFKA